MPRGLSWSRRAWLTALALAPACRRAPADPVQALLAEGEAAAEARDADRFGALLSRSFRSRQGMDRGAVLAELRRLFALYQTVGVTLYGVEQAREEGGPLDVRCVVEFSGEAKKIGALQGLLPPSAVYRFELTLAEEEGVLRISRARWEPVEPSPLP